MPEAVYRPLDRHQGMILVTGPTGSGKSTTQASMIDHINRNRACHIVTVEDPIEYVHDHRAAIVDQRQVGIDTPSFAEALRAVFREDPDVVLIGEMRDLETMASALIPVIGRFSSAQNLARKCHNRCGMSSRRKRKGGIVSGSTCRR